MRTLPAVYIGYQTTDKMEKYIIGKRILLFPFEASELTHFVELHRSDKQGMMGKFCLKEMTQEEGSAYITALFLTGQLKVWSCYTKEGRASRKIGYIYLTEISPFSCQLIGIIDKEILKGLAKVMRKGKYSFSEDAIRTIVDYCFCHGMTRVEYRVFTENKLSIHLAEKSGFQREGVLRRCFLVGNEYKDIAVYSMLKDLSKLSEEGKTTDKK